jgi:transcriptional regulator with XRE-family HTH domain
MKFSKIEQKKLKVLGDRIRDLRLKKGLTQKQLGLSLDKDFQSISRIESGRQNPSLLFLMQICAGLEISVSELLKDL